MNKLFTAVLLTMLVISSCKANDNSAMKASPKAENTVLSAGDYLRVDYVERLRTTLSPFSSGQIEAPQLIILRSDNDKFLLEPIFDFHEGGPKFLLDNNGNISVQESGGFGTENLKLDITDLQHFTLSFDKFKKIPYIYVENAERFIAENVLVGEYLDSKGQRYILDNDGQAVFPDRKFQYSIGTDHVLNNFDYFVDDKAKKIYGFKRFKEELDIFATNGEISQNIDEKPFLILKKTGPNKNGM